MMTTNDLMLLTSLFFMGLFGGAHCLGMCGGVIAAMGFTSNQNQTITTLLYNAGRITSYCIIGVIAGSIGSIAHPVLQEYHGLIFIRAFTGLLLILAGLYIAQWSFLLGKIERLGNVIWQRVKPLGQALYPVKSPQQAFKIGLLWGWLPCGLVYSALMFALVADSASQGGLMLLFFGLGTAVLVLPAGIAAAHLKKWLQTKEIKQLSGLAVMSFGAWFIVMAMYHGAVSLGICQPIT